MVIPLDSAPAHRQHPPRRLFGSMSESLTIATAVRAGCGWSCVLGGRLR